jgi:6-phosphofructokinase
MKKGNMLIAQSGGPSMVINQSLVGAVLAARDCKTVGKIYGALHGIQGILDERFIDLRKESRKTLEAVANTPSSALGSVRRKPTPQDCQAIFGVLRKLEVRYFFYIGGNDSAETVHIINEEAVKAEYGISCFHIPKTIDNDLRENDHTPGFGSAARFVACAVKGDDLDNRALGGVKIDVIMGRNAGFLTACSALAREEDDDGPHLVYLPERPFSVDAFVKDVKAAMKKFGRCVVAVSEGIADKDGTPIHRQFTQETDSHGNVQLSGTARWATCWRRWSRSGRASSACAPTRSATCSAPSPASPPRATPWRRGSSARRRFRPQFATRSRAARSPSSAGPARNTPWTSRSCRCARWLRRRATCPTRSSTRPATTSRRRSSDYARPLVGGLPPCARFAQLKG